MNSLLVVRVTGERPSDADSGFVFSRYARDILKIAEDQIVAPDKAIGVLAAKRTGNVLFVDDFIGSGEQFITMWRRPAQLGPKGGVESFESIAATSNGKIGFYYCPCVSTAYGRDNIKHVCPDVRLSAAHVLDSRNSALSDDSVIWRDDMAKEGPDFIQKASARAGILDVGGGVGDWRGFHKLGLTVSFAHNWPDATLPLFYWNKNGWTPLLKKGEV